MKFGCDDFRQRLNEVIDQRLDPREDQTLHKHASRCPSCGCELQAWVQIQSIYSSRTQTQKSLRTSPCDVPWGILVASAAAILFGAVGSYFALRGRPDTLVSVDANEPIQHSTRIQSSTSPDELTNDSARGSTSSINSRSGISNGSLNSLGNRSAAVEELWSRVQHRDWIDQSMPTVRKVGQSVAPLGRSIRKAVSLLTVGGGETS
jgi:hypothetical protein